VYDVYHEKKDPNPEKKEKGNVRKRTNQNAVKKRGGGAGTSEKSKKSGQGFNRKCFLPAAGREPTLGKGQKERKASKEQFRMEKAQRTMCGIPSGKSSPKGVDSSKSKKKDKCATTDGEKRNTVASSKGGNQGTGGNRMKGKTVGNTPKKKKKEKKRKRHLAEGLTHAWPGKPLTSRGGEGRGQERQQTERRRPKR